MAPFDRPLDVLRIMVGPTNDDEILQAAGDEELAVTQKSEVSGAQIRFARSAGYSRLKLLLVSSCRCQ